MKQNEIILNADRAFLTIEFTETIIQNREASAENEFNYVMMSVTFFTNLVQKKEEKQKKIEMFSVSMTDIEKALTSQKKTDLRTILSDHYHEFLDVFNCTMTEKLLLLREEDTDHQRVKSILRFSIQHDEREATNVAQNINRTFE